MTSSHAVAASVRPEVLVTEDLSKTFGETQALISVDFALQRGEIRSLVGGNGSGKSTFIKILAGVERPDRGGTIRLPTGEIRESGLTPEVARGAGLRFVHQDTGVIDHLTVAENLALGSSYPTNAIGLISWRSANSRAQATLNHFDVAVRPDQEVTALSTLLRTKVAVARALQDVDDEHPGVLVFDEPTTSMSSRDAHVFLDWLRNFAGRGQSVIFVSHRLDEVLALSESVTVFRDGRSVATIGGSELDEHRLVEMMTGRQLPKTTERSVPVEADSFRLELHQVSAGPLRHLDLQLGNGEIVGVAGLLGSGRSSLLRTVMGDLPLTAGEMLIDGAPYRPSTVIDGMDAGVGYVPEDRLGDALFPDLTVTENLSAARIRESSRRGWLSARGERQSAHRLVDDFRVRCGSSRHTLATLSGGNQQKVVLARWLSRQPRVLLLDEPSQGVDVLARRDIEEFVRQGANTGTAVLVVTSDFDELARLADRVVVLRQGRIVAELRRPDITEEAITDLTYGSTGVLDVHAPA